MEYLLRASNSLPADESHDIYIYIGLSVRLGFKHGINKAKK